MLFLIYILLFTDQKKKKLFPLGMRLIETVSALPLELGMMGMFLCICYGSEVLNYGCSYDMG